MVRVVVALVGALLLVAADARADSLPNDFWVSGNYTQKHPCKGDGTDPPDLKVKITPQQITFNNGVCTFIDAKPEGDHIDTHVECQFSAGPLIGDVTFTQKPDNTVD